MSPEDYESTKNLVNVLFAAIGGLFLVLVAGAGAVWKHLTNKNTAEKDLVASRLEATEKKVEKIETRISEIKELLRREQNKGRYWGKGPS